MKNVQNICSYNSLIVLSKLFCSFWCEEFFETMILRFKKSNLQVVASRVFKVQSFKNMCFREEEHTILLAPSKPKSDYHRKNRSNVKITNLPRIHTSVLLKLYTVLQSMYTANPVPHRPVYSLSIYNFYIALVFPVVVQFWFWTCQQNCMYFLSKTHIFKTLYLKNSRSYNL